MHLALQTVGLVRALGADRTPLARENLALPQQLRCFERVIGSIRRECTDHLVPLNAAHLRTIISEYVAYYNRARCHQSLGGNAPEPRPADHGDGSVYAIPHLGGLHHEYLRAG